MEKITWSLLSSSKDGHRVRFYRHRGINRVKDKLETVFYTFDAVVARHYLCGAGLPEWAWNLPLGKRVYAEDAPEVLENSLAAKIFDANSRLMAWFDEGQERGMVCEVTLTEAQYDSLVANMDGE